MIKEKTCPTAKQLMDKLSAINQREGTWLFRGVTDAGKKLLPTLYRDDCPLHELVADSMSQNAVANPESFEDQVERNKIELALLHAYCNKMAHNLERLLGLIGIPVPVNHNFISPAEMNRGSVQKLFSSYLSHINGRIHTYGPSEIIHAYARHAGLPSVLLDWTYDYEVAAFFAYFAEANSAGFNEDDDGAVWAVNESVIESTDLIRHPQANAATGQVSFMQKQSALFLYDRGQGDHFIKHSKWRTFEQVFSDSEVDEGLIYKLIIPGSEKSNLRKYLTKRRVIKSQLMPTIYTAAEDVMSGKIEWLND